MTHGNAREGKWKENWRREWVASTLYTTSEHGVSSITTADAHTSAANSRQNWRPRRFKWTRPFRLKTKSSYCACAIAFKTQSNWFVSPIPVAARSKAWVCGHSLAGIACSNPSVSMDISLVSVMCCQVEVSASGRSLVQRAWFYSWNRTNNYVFIYVSCHVFFNYVLIMGTTSLDYRVREYVRAVVRMWWR
jgi:hypothetical protein